MRTLGLARSDFGIFTIEGFSARVQQIDQVTRPKLVRIGRQVAPELSRRLEREMHTHLARHPRSTVNPPSETGLAFSASRSGFKRHPHFVLGVSALGVHARLVVKTEADGRSQMAARIADQANVLEKSFGPTRVARFDNWELSRFPPEVHVDQRFLHAVADTLGKRSGGLDLGFAWPVREAVALDPAEVSDAFHELEPLYRVVTGLFRSQTGEEQS